MKKLLQDMQKKFESLKMDYDLEIEELSKINKKSQNILELKEHTDSLYQYQQEKERCAAVAKELNDIKLKYSNQCKEMAENKASQIQERILNTNKIKDLESTLSVVAKELDEIKLRHSNQSKEIPENSPKIASKIQVKLLNTNKVKDL